MSGLFCVNVQDLVICPDLSSRSDNEVFYVHYTCFLFSLLPFDDDNRSANEVSYVHYTYFLFSLLPFDDDCSEMCAFYLFFPKIF